MLLLLQRSSHNFFISVVTECICATGGTLSRTAGPGRPATDRAFQRTLFPISIRHFSSYTTRRRIVQQQLFVSCVWPFCWVCSVPLDFEVYRAGLWHFLFLLPRTGSISQRRCAMQFIAHQQFYFIGKYFYAQRCLPFCYEDLFSTAQPLNIISRLKLNLPEQSLAMHGSVKKTLFQHSNSLISPFQNILRFKTLMEYRSSSGIGLAQWPASQKLHKSSQKIQNGTQENDIIKRKTETHKSNTKIHRKYKWNTENDIIKSKTETHKSNTKVHRKYKMEHKKII